MVAKKAAAKKTAGTSKSTSKTTAATPATVGPHTVVPPENVNPMPEGAVLPASTSKKASSEVTEIARQALTRGSRWGSGRERDEMVRAAGHDPAAVRDEMHRLRVEKQADNG